MDSEISTCRSLHTHLASNSLRAFESTIVNAFDAFFLLLHRMPTHLCLRLKRIRELPHIHLQRSLVPQELHVRAIDTHAAFLTLGDVLLATQRREAPVLRDDDLLAAGEFVLAAAESFDGGGAVCEDMLVETQCVGVVGGK